MGKEKKFFMDSAWFIHVVVPIVSAGVGLPISLILLLEGGGGSGRIAIGFAPILLCGATGYLLFVIIRWLCPSGEEEESAK